jgi:thiosulfate dehydrogenase (quinone) large subunit
MKTKSEHRTLRDPEFFRWVFNDPRAAWIWLPVRLWLGYQWVTSSLSKINNPAWVETGAALKGFWTAAVAIPENGRAPIAFGWYRSFIELMLETESYTWFAKLVAFGELAIGVALILGLLTGAAAFFGGFMNWNFMMAGSASTNPVLFLLSIGLLLAWKVSGRLGLDYFLLNAIEYPWETGKNRKVLTKQGLAGQGSSQD